METLKKIVTNQYFPAAAVLASVLIYWTVGFLGGLSLLHNNQPPLTTLTWLLFVYASAALTPLAGALAVVDLVRRWRRDRAVAPARAGQTEQAAPAMVNQAAEAPVMDSPVQNAPAPTPPAPTPPAPTGTAAKQPGANKTASKKPATKKPGTKKAA